nr:10693_t:CDS:1 [Entrophospora candida]CAG8535810.1 379_t:CDS:1 [Entrophospora candida]
MITKAVAAPISTDDNTDVIFDYTSSIALLLLAYFSIKESEIDITEMWLYTILSFSFIFLKAGFFTWFCIKKYHDTGDHLFIVYVIVILAVGFVAVVYTSITIHLSIYIINEDKGHLGDRVHDFSLRYPKAGFYISLIQVFFLDISQFIFLGIYASRGYYESNRYLFIVIPTLLMALCATTKCIYVIFTSETSGRKKTSGRQIVKNIVKGQFYQSLLLMLFAGDVIEMLLLNLDPIWTKVYLTIDATSFVLGGIVINAAEKKAEEKAKRNSVVGGQQPQTREGPTTV